MQEIPLRQDDWDYEVSFIEGDFVPKHEVMTRKITALKRLEKKKAVSVDKAKAKVPKKPIIF